MPLLASTLQDDLLAASLDQLYLAPLRAERDGGEAAKETLRAYFAASGNASSAASALGVNRRTVAARIASIEEKIGRTVDSVSAEIETALRLDEIEPQPDSP
jgi:DNA-binding PucR family transcriptional regulator